MLSLAPNFANVGHQGLALPLGTCQLSSEEFDRPAKDLTLEVLYHLSLKLQNTLRGNWASLAEILGYGRDRIEEFEHQSAAEHTPPGFMVLRNWTGQEAGRSIYVLLESLKQCGRLDCVAFLEQEIQNILSMKLHLKITDETLPVGTAKPYFLTVATRCQATLKDSLENVFGGEIQDYDICASWSDRAHQFKGMHLSMRRKRRSGPCASPFALYGEYNRYHYEAHLNNLSPSGADVGAQVDFVSSQQDMDILGKEHNITGNERITSNVGRNILPDEHEEDVIHSEEGNDLIVAVSGQTNLKTPYISQENYPTFHRGFVSEECMYCGKFRTFSQKISQIPRAEAGQRRVRRIESGVHCHTCMCDLSVIGRKNYLPNVRMSCSQPHEAVMGTGIRDVTVTKKSAADQDSDNVVSSTTDMDTDTNSAQSKAGEDKTSDTSGYRSSSNMESHTCFHVDVIENEAMEETFVKKPYMSQTHCKFVRVVTENITMENDRDHVHDKPNPAMTRSISDTSTSYQRLNQCTRCEGVVERIILDNGQVMDTHHVETIGDVFTLPRRSPVEHSEPSTTTDHDMPVPYRCPDEHRVQVLLQTPDFTRTVPPNGAVCVPKIDETRDCFPQSHRPSIQDTTRPALPARQRTRDGLSPPSGDNTPPALPPRPNRPAPYPISRSAGSDSKFTHLNKTLNNYPGWNPCISEHKVEDRMRRHIVSDGHYMLWYMAPKRLLVLSVSHLRKLIHYAIYVTRERDQLLYFIFKGETFTDLYTLLDYYKCHGLKPQSLQGRFANNFIAQQNRRGSLQIARLSHVELLHPVLQSTRERFSF